MNDLNQIINTVVISESPAAFTEIINRAYNINVKYFNLELLEEKAADNFNSYLTNNDNLQNFQPYECFLQDVLDQYQKIGGSFFLLNEDYNRLISCIETDNKPLFDEITKYNSLVKELFKMQLSEEIKQYGVSETIKRHGVNILSFSEIIKKIEAEYLKKNDFNINFFDYGDSYCKNFVNITAFYWQHRSEFEAAANKFINHIRSI